jgi:hypothetical protein
MEKGGTKRTGVPVKTLKKLLKRAGLKVSGKKATLTRRAKKARLLKGGLPEFVNKRLPETGFLANFKTHNPSTPATNINLRPDTGPNKIEGLPAARLTTAQQKAKDENDKYLAQIAAQKQDHEDRKRAAEEQYMRDNYTGGPVQNEHGFVKGVNKVLSAFRGGGKKKRSRRS